MQRRGGAQRRGVEGGGEEGWVDREVVGRGGGVEGGGGIEGWQRRVDRGWWEEEEDRVEVTRGHAPTPIPAPRTRRAELAVVENAAAVALVQLLTHGQTLHWGGQARD